MKSVTAIIFFFLVYSCNLCAQKKSWTVKAGEEINDALAPDVKFRYPNFISGYVYFKDGTNSNAPLNYNLLNEEMQFINTNGDTLSIDNEYTIKYMTISNDTFYYSKRYLELVSANPLVKLAKAQRLKIGDTKKIGGYDQASSTSAITSITSINSDSRVTKIGQRAELLLVKETTFYIGDSFNHFEIANKKNIIKMFGRQEASIGSFLKDNKIKFYNEDDLKKLIDFLQDIL